MDVRKLLFTLLFSTVLLLSLTAQDTLIVKGLITNNSSVPILVNIEIDNHTTHAQSSSVFSDSSGHYADTFIVNRAQGSVFVWIADCNRDTISKNDGYYSSRLTITIDLDYCPNTTHPCTALFSMVQAYNSHQQPIPYLIHIIDHSTGSGLSYLWDFGDGHSSTSSSPTHTYSGHGPYVLCLTVSTSQCSDTFCDTVAIDTNGHLKSGQGFTIIVGGDIPTGIAPNEEEDISLELFPNPAEGSINLLMNSADTGPANIIIRDSFGRLILKNKVLIHSDKQVIEMDIDMINPGFYFLQMEFNGIVNIIKFMKK